jgi:aminopeptidase-like protein
MMTILAYADGAHGLLSIAEMLDVPVWELHAIARKLLAHDLLIEGGEEEAGEMRA